VRRTANISQFWKFSWNPKAVAVQQKGDIITARLTSVFVGVHRLQLQGAAEQGDLDENYARTGSSAEPLSYIAQSLMCDELMCASDDDGSCSSR